MLSARGHRDEHEQGYEACREACRFQGSIHPQRSLRIGSWMNDGQAVIAGPVATGVPETIDGRAADPTRARIGAKATAGTAASAGRVATAATASRASRRA